MEHQERAIRMVAEIARLKLALEQAQQTRVAVSNASIAYEESRRALLDYQEEHLAPLPNGWFWAMAGYNWTPIARGPVLSLHRTSSGLWVNLGDFFESMEQEVSWGVLDAVWASGGLIPPGASATGYPCRVERRDGAVITIDPYGGDESRISQMKDGKVLIRLSTQETEIPWSSFEALRGSLK